MTRCSYDSWKTKIPKSLNQLHLAALRAMKDGKVRSRCEMLRRAKPPTDPNPRNENGFAVWNKIDYNLYKMGFLIFSRVDNAGQRFFRISAKGLKLLNGPAKGLSFYKL